MAVRNLFTSGPSMLPTIDVEILGAREAVKSLGKLPRETRLATRRAIREPATKLKKMAQANVPREPPLTGWRRWQGGRLAWSTKARSDIGVRIGGGKKSDNVWEVVRLEQKSAPGAVFEVAGRRSSGKGPQGRAFVSGLNRGHGGASRAMWRAVDDSPEDIQRAIIKAVEDAIATVNRELG